MYGAISTIYLSISNAILNRPKRVLQSFFLPDVNIIFCVSDYYLVRQGHPRFTGTKSILFNFKNVKNLCVCVYLNIHIIYK